MKTKPSRRYESWNGMSREDDPDRIDDRYCVALENGIPTRTGRITKSGGFYPTTYALAMGITQETKIHTLARYKGKDSIARAVAVAGSRFLRSGAANIYSTWTAATYPTDIATPALNRPAAIVFRNRYVYHQNGVDIPFRWKMEEDDGTTPGTEVEVLGLRPPLWFSSGTLVSSTAGVRFPADRGTAYALTFVYGDRGESCPSPVQIIHSATGNDSFTFDNIPTGPSGCTARRVYRSQIGRVENPGGEATTEGGIKRVLGYNPANYEMFFLREISDNTSTTFEDNFDDSTLDFLTRIPPMRLFPPRAYYQIQHLDRIFWANLRDHPWTMGIVSDPDVALTSAVITISNTGNGTITITTNLATVTVSDYKTKPLIRILFEINVSGGSGYSQALGVGQVSCDDDIVARQAPGVDVDRTYVFNEVTSRSILGNANVYWLQAIDGDPVVVDGPERFPNRVVFSDITFPEEVNAFNTFDISKDDAYPIRGLFRNDYTLAPMTQNTIWLVTGSFIENEFYVPDFSVNRSQSEHGNFCTRPDSIAETPDGFFFIAEDGLRYFKGQSSQRIGHAIDPVLMARLRIEPRTRDSVAMNYRSGKLRIAFPGLEVR